MLSVVLMDSTAMRDILTLDLQYERQTVAHLQQEIVTLQDECISGTRSVLSSRSSCLPESTLLR
jgi:bacterioferritin (cytochrome b1)